jgi:hypothetical protein
MFIRRLLTTTVAAATAAFALAAPASAHPSLQAAGYVSGWTGARAWATSAALLGLIGVVIGAVALTRRVRSANLGQRGGKVALVLGLIALVVGVLNLAVSDGGPGTGNGVVGGAIAIVFGLIALGLGWRGMSTSRSSA